MPKNCPSSHHQSLAECNVRNINTYTKRSLIYNRLRIHTQSETVTLAMIRDHYIQDISTFHKARTGRTTDEEQKKQRRKEEYIQETKKKGRTAQNVTMKDTREHKVRR